MSDQQNTNVPTRSGGDAIHAVVKAVLSAIPVYGGPAVELFQFVVQPPLEKRREKWMCDVGEQLTKLQEKGLDIASLQGNEAFISVVMQASQAALKTHKSEKLLALRNAVINVAIGKGPEETVQHHWLNCIDELSEMHLRILKVFLAPTAPPGVTMGDFSHVIDFNIPELRGHEELVRQLWRDLYSRGLVRTEGMSGSDLRERRTTEWGKQLLEFISVEPL